MIRQRHHLLAGCVFVAVTALASVTLLTSAARADPPEYTIVDLGTLDAGPYTAYSFARGINDSGQVVGSSNTARGARAFLWEDGEMIDLGALTSSYDAFSHARAINDLGQVVGTSNATAGFAPHAFLWEDGVMTDLGTLGGWQSDAYGINNHGQIVGGSVTSGGAWHAFLWQDGVMTDLGTLPGGTWTQALAINALGQVVGYSEGHPPYGLRHAFLWENGVMTDLGPVPGGLASMAVGINALGQVIGYEVDIGGGAFLWQDGVYTSLGTLPGGFMSWARGINDLSEVVGDGGSPGTDGHAFRWRDGVMTDLGTLPGSTRSAAWDVNNRGMIVGQSNPAGNWYPHAVMWARDTEPPVITGLNDRVANATTPQGAIVEFTATAWDETDGDVPVTCKPPSGSTFPIGDTTVHCEATDAAGNTATASFKVTVKGAAEQLADLGGDVQDVGPGTSLADKVMAAQAAYTAGDTPRTCEILNAFINLVRAQSGKSIGDPGTAEMLIADAMRIRAVLGC